MRTVVFILAILVATTATSAGLNFQFNSPAFNGIGYSSHVLTVEQLEANRRKTRQDDAQAKADKLLRDAENTNMAKFLNNLESRVYATLSKQLADQLFAEEGASSGEMDLMGNTIKWSNDGSEITLEITDEYGSVTTVTIPVGDFQF